MRAHVLRGLLVLSIVSLALWACNGGQEAKQPGGGGDTVTPRGGIQIAASVSSLPADGASSSDIVATVRNAGGSLVSDGTTVAFQIVSGPLDPGDLSAASAVTAAGRAEVIYTAGVLAGSVQIRATAEVDGQTIASTVTLTLQGVVISLTADPPAVQAGGTQADITAQVRYSGGAPVPQGTTVLFETTLGILSATQTVTNLTGLAAVTLTSSALPGTATVTATALGASQSVNVGFTELPPTVRTIELSVLESPEVGVLGSWLPQTSELQFLAKDMFGDPVGAGYSVEFVILSGPNKGEQMFPPVAQTSAAGVASAVFTAGIQSGTARILARFRDNPTVVSNAVVITIHAGLPDGLNFGLWAEIVNMAGLRFFNLEDPVTACPSDSFLNPVPDGTALYFTTNYGKVNSAATTTDGEGPSKLTSQRPLPPDGFVTYQASTQSGLLSRVLVITPDPSDASGNTIWVGTDGDGIYRTLDGGTNWLHVGDFASGLTNGIVRDIALDPGDTRIVYAGTDGGVFKSVGGGAWEDLTGWKRITGEYLGTGAAAAPDGASSPYALEYASTQQRARTRVYVNGVETIQYFYTSDSAIRMIGSHSGVITMDYDLDLGFPSQYPVNAIAVDSDATDPLDRSTVYAATGGGGIFKSEDGGFTWRAVNRGLSNQDVLCLVRNEGDGTLYAGTRGGVFRSTDGGEVWTRRVAGLTDWVVQALVVDGPNLVAGTATRGIFLSANRGDTWQAAGQNVNAQKTTNGDVTDIVAQGASVLYASTREGGVFRSSNGGGAWTPLTNVFGESLGLADGATYIFPLALACNEDKPSTEVYVGGDSLPYGAYNFQGSQAIALFDPPASGAVTADYVIADYPSAYTYALGLTPAGALFAGGNERNLVKTTNGGTSWQDSNGVGVFRIENDVYVAAKAVFSGGTAHPWPLRLAIHNPDHIAGPDDLSGIRLEGTNYGADYSVEFGGYETYLFTLSDANGNPLVGGSSFTLETDCGSDVVRLTGNLSDTINDTLRGETDYFFTASNANETDESEICTFTLTVTSEEDALGQPGNGSPGEISVAQTFWAKLKVDPAEASIKPDESQRLAAIGGSGSFSWTAPGAAVTSGSGATFMFVPDGIGNYTVTLRDTRTGETAQSYITVKADE